MRTVVAHAAVCYYWFQRGRRFVKASRFVKLTLPHAVVGTPGMARRDGFDCMLPVVPAGVDEQFRMGARFGNSCGCSCRRRPIVWDGPTQCVGRGAQFGNSGCRPCRRSFFVVVGQTHCFSSAGVLWQSQSHVPVVAAMAIFSVSE